MATLASAVLKQARAFDDPSEFRSGRSTPPYERLFPRAEGIPTLTRLSRRDTITADLDNWSSVVNAISRGNPELEEVLATRKDPLLDYVAAKRSASIFLLGRAVEIVNPGRHARQDASTTALAGWRAGRSTRSWNPSLAGRA
jgi:hypothetical protein